MNDQFRKPLTNSNFANPASAQLRAIVLDYLCHNSYINTARAFSRDSAVKNVDADGDEIMNSAGCDEEEPALSEDMLTQVEIRKDIRHRILGGNVDQAVELLDRHFPTVLSEAEPFIPRPPSSSNKLEFLATTSVDPAHLSLNLRILAFIEACRTTPLNYTLPGTSAASASETMTVDDNSLPTYNPQDPVAYEKRLNDLLTRVRKLYSSAHALQNPNDRGTYLNELGQVGGLLAYKVPEESPMAKYLSQQRREAVADQINSAVLYRTGLPAISKLELHARYTTTLWSWMHEMRYELPPQKFWPLGVQPPLSENTSNEPAFRHSTKDIREVVPAFDLEEFLETKSV